MPNVRSISLLVTLALCVAGCDSGSPGPGTGTNGSSPAANSTGAPKLAFKETAAERGLDFRHQNGAEGSLWLPEIMSGGGAFLDYDGDGWLDVFFAQSGHVQRPDEHGGSKLYRNVDGQKFVDVTATTGARVQGLGMGCTAGDYDRDGDVDLFVTRIGSDVLLRNEGGRFVDVTTESGLGDEGYGTSAAFFDADNDGDLDLYVARYLRWSPEKAIRCRSQRTQVIDYCNPTAYPQVSDLFYRNQGDGTFVDESVRSGIGEIVGYGLAVAAADFDQDGRVDLYVAKDQSPALLWRNLGDGRFQNVATMMAAALDGQSAAIAGMGIAAEDFDFDGDIDIFVTNIRGSANLFLESRGPMYRDSSARWGERKWLTLYTGFGVVCFDQDLDGRLDMFIANGGVNRNAAPYRDDSPYAEPNSFLRQSGEGSRFVDASAELPARSREADVARAAALGDFDNDGDLDVLVCRNADTPLLLENTPPAGATWLVVDPRDERGRVVLNTRVTVVAGGRSWTREVRRQQSYLSSGDPRVHFGLAGAAKVDRIEIRWPDGSVESTGTVPANRFVQLRRGAAAKPEIRE